MTPDRTILEPPVLQTLQVLCQKRRVHRLSLFGSGAEGNLTEESDLDFMVEFEELSPPAHADAYFGLLADLEAIFQRRIDLLEKSAIENPYLLRGIERSRRLVYEAA